MEAKTNKLEILTQYEMITELQERFKENNSVVTQDFFDINTAKYNFKYIALRYDPRYRPNMKDDFRYNIIAFSNSSDNLKEYCENVLKLKPEEKEYDRGYIIVDSYDAKFRYNVEY